MDPELLAAELVEKLRAVGTAERAEHDKEYLKSDLVHLGASLPDIRNIVRDLRRDEPDAIANPWPLVDACWRLGIYDARAAMGLFLERANVGRDDVPKVERILRDSHTWALVDQIAIHVVPRTKPNPSKVEAWARDPDVWMRRAALLSDLKALRAGKGHYQNWRQLAVKNLADPDERIKKTIGWVLREIGKQRPELTEQFVAQNEANMSALSLREATRNLEDGR